MAIEDLQELILTPQYSKDDFANMLRSLLPRGKAWNIPLETEYEIKLTSTHSLLSFGFMVVSQEDSIIYMIGVSSSLSINSITVSNSPPP